MSRKQLDQLIERASAFADDAMKQTGEVAPIWHMVTAKGETIIELTPPGDRDCALMDLANADGVDGRGPLRPHLRRLDARQG